MQRQTAHGTTRRGATGVHRPWYPRAIIIGMVLSLGIGVGIAQAKDRRERRRAVQQQVVPQQPVTRLAQAGEVRFNIPPQPLSSALRQFSQVTNLALTFDAALTQGLHTQGISGTYAPEQALQQLLTGTGLQSRFTNANTVTLERQVAQGQGPAAGQQPGERGATARAGYGGGRAPCPRL